MTIIRKTDGFFESAIDGDIVLMNAKTGEFSALRDTGLAIWRMIDDENDVAAIKTALAAQFDAPGDVVAAEVDAFVDTLEKAGLLVVAR